MPKKTKLTGTFEIKTPNSTGFKKYAVELDWEGQSLQNKQGGVLQKRRNIDLSEVLHWDVDREQQLIVLKIWSKSEKKARDWQFKILQGEFNTWLYWLLVSILKHSNCSIEDNKLKGMKPSQKGKVQARRDMGRFDQSHRTFVNAQERFDRGDSLSPGRNANSELFGTSGSKYQFERSIKKGGQAVLFNANKELISIICGEDQDMIYHPSPEPVVIKSVRLESLDGKMQEEAIAVIKEARILAALGEHPNIIRLLDVVASDRGIYVMLEKGEEDLLKFGKKGILSVKQMLKIVIGMLEGLSHMHQRSVYHMDIKPENILMFSDGTPKLIDFGFARSKAIDSKKDMKDTVKSVTPGYVPPETWDTFPQKGSEIVERLEKRDSYAAGMTILDGLIAPKYHWDWKMQSAGGTNKIYEGKKNHYWTVKIKQSVETMQDGILKDLALITSAMIEINFEHRLTAQQALNHYQQKYRQLLDRHKHSSRQNTEAIRKYQHLQKKVGDMDVIEAIVTGKRKAPPRPSKVNRLPISSLKK